MSEVEERPATKTEQRETAEQIARGLISDEEQKRSANEIAQAFLREITPAERDESVAGIQKEIKKLSAQKRFQQVEEKRALYSELIQGGRAAYEARVTAIETSGELSPEAKEGQLAELSQDYHDSIILEKMMKMRAVDKILRAVMNPQSLQSSESYGTIYHEEQQRWISSWDPEQHHQAGSSQFIAPATINAIRSGLEDFFERNQQVRNLVEEAERWRGKKIQRNDLTAAEYILRRNRNPNIFLGGDAEVIVGPISVTIVNHDDRDYADATGRQSDTSMGVHYHDSLVNNVRGGAYRGPAEIAKTTAHENEHSLNEILHAQQTLSYQDKPEVSVFKREAETSGQISHETAELIQQLLATRLLFESVGLNQLGFADEVLAHSLGSERDADEVIQLLVESDAYSRFTVDARGMKASIKQKMSRIFLNDFIYSPDYDRLKEQLDELVDRLPDELVVDAIARVKRGMAQALADLSRGGYTKNEIRALTAGENPCYWPKLVVEFSKRFPQGGAALRTAREPVIAQAEEQIEQRVTQEEKQANRRIEIANRVTQLEEAAVNYTIPDLLINEKWSDLKSDLIRRIEEGLVSSTTYLAELEIIDSEKKVEVLRELGGERLAAFFDAFVQKVQSRLEQDSGSRSAVLRYTAGLVSVYDESVRKQAGISAAQIAELTNLVLDGGSGRKMIIAEVFDFLDQFGRDQDRNISSLAKALNLIIDAETIRPGFFIADQPDFLSSVWSKIEADLQRLAEEDPADAESQRYKVFAAIKILFPDKFEQLHLKGHVEWDKLDFERFKKYPIAGLSTARNLMIIAADEINPPIGGS